MNTIIIGMGEVGRAHFNVLSKTYPDSIYYKDIADQVYDSKGNKYHQNGKSFDLMAVATQCDPNNITKYIDMVEQYSMVYCPKIIDIWTTTPCGTCDKIQERIGKSVKICKSTIRGSHPCLDKFLLDIPKHIGGPSKSELSDYYSAAGIPCVVHEKAKAVELFHILNNSDYGVAIMKAKENYDLCRKYGISYIEWLKYKSTNNEGFVSAGFPDKVSPILTPPSNGILGHCVVYSATTIVKEDRGPLIEMLANYNRINNAPTKSDSN